MWAQTHPESTQKVIVLFFQLNSGCVMEVIDVADVFEAISTVMVSG
jgi:hypothetical protein